MNKHVTFINIAKELALQSKCVSLNVGCIAVNSRGRIIGSGVNGTISGSKNCCDVHKDRGPEHTEWSDKYEIHAEMNCILEMAKGSTTAKELTFYTSVSPCFNCLKHMMGMKSAGEIDVFAIIYAEQYYRTPDSVIAEQKAFCNEFGVLLASINEVTNHNRV